MERIWRATLPNERAAIFAFVITVLAIVWFESITGISKLIPAGIGSFAALILMLLSAFGFVWAKSYVSAERWRAALVAPVLLIAALSIANPTAAITRQVFGRIYLHNNETSFLRTNLREYELLPFRSGIPDGGTAIIRTSTLRPDKLTQTQMIELVGEPINWCASLDRDSYLCGYG